VIHKKLDPVLFMCLVRKDRKLSIMQVLLQARASANQQMKVALGKCLEEETASVLLSTAKRAASKDGVALTQLLINHGGK
jgi:hypothetical protein